MKFILGFLKISLLLFIMCVGTIAAAKQPVVYTEDNTVIAVTAAQPQFIIKLKSNPTTGYSWFLQSYDEKLITPVKHHYQPGDAKLMGAPGHEVWLFKMKPAAFTAPQQTTLRFIYARPWEKTNTVSETVFKIVTQ